MKQDIFKKIGLNENEIEIFDCLLENESLTATQLSKKTSLNRTNVYNFVEELEDKQLIESFKKGAKNYYRLAHPSSLKKLFDKKEQEFNRSQEDLEVVLSELTSKYNLAFKKPGVIYYEGIEVGLRRADFLVEEKVLVELKAITTLEDVHLAQVLNYLEAYRLEIGLLINFGAKRLEFKRLINEKKLK